MVGELTAKEIEFLLRAEWVARLGLHHEGRTYVVPIHYVFDGSAIYGRTNEGTKLAMMRANPAVCVEVDHVDDPSNWQSVMAWGSFAELHGHAASTATKMLLARIGPLMRGGTHAPAHWRPMEAEQDQSMVPAVVYRVVLERATGRYERR